MLGVTSYSRMMNGRAVSFYKALSARHFASMSPAEYIRKEEHYGAVCYHALPVVIEKALGVHVWDVEGKKYLDFLAGIGACNQGHCHPKIVQAMTKQINTLHHVSRGMYHSTMGDYFEFVTKMFGYDKVFPCNTGVETGETAIKLARRWGYKHKGVPDEQAKVVMCDSNFWGRTITATSSSTDHHSRERFGPYTPGFLHIPFNDVDSLEECLASDPTICAFMVEPIQGEGGIRVPDKGYMSEVHRICKKHNVLLIVDEVQTGIGRTGKDICCDWSDVKPDILLLAKGLGGGFYPVSAVFANDEIMSGLLRGQHGSTFGGNPVACAAATAALTVLKEENLCENSRIMGERLRDGLNACDIPRVKEVRGLGLLNAVEVDCSDKKDAEAFLVDICVRLRDAGLVTKWVKGNAIRLQPPLTMNADQIDEGISIISSVLKAC